MLFAKSRFMRRIRLIAHGLIAALAFAAQAHQSPAVQSDEKPAPKGTQNVKLELSPESLPHVLALVRPQENEWRHLKVEWLTDVVAARKRAAAEDKPIIICYTGGAGYNEPLGVC